VRWSGATRRAFGAEDQPLNDVAAMRQVALPRHTRAGLLRPGRVSARSTA
jgi:hypothetical protein